MPADLILRDATVHTVDAARRTATAVAIDAGRIAAVGDARAVDALRGPATRVVDLDGAMVLPGFQDAHCHLGESGHATTLSSLEGSRDVLLVKKFAIDRLLKKPADLQAGAAPPATPKK